MKGLLLKDLFNLKKQARSYLLMLALWVAIAVFNRQPAFLSGVTCCFAFMIPMSAFGYDERGKWNRYALTMPLSRWQLVLSKYVLGLLGVGFVTALSLVVGGLMGMPVLDGLQVSLGSGVVVLYLLAVMLPILFRFGAEKGRVIMMAVALVPLLLSGIFSMERFAGPTEKLSGSTQVLGWLLLALCLPVVALSARISLGIFEKKDIS